MENKLATDDDKLTRYVAYFEAAEQASTASRQLAERTRDYYDGDQWTANELATLKRRKQPPVTINRIAPKINYLLGLEAQRRSMPKAHSRTPKHQTDAEAATDALRFVIEEQRFDLTRSQAFENLCIEGVCGVDISVVQVNGDYKVRIQHIQWNRLFYDEHSRRRDFSDAKVLGQVIWQDFDDALLEFPGAQGALESTLTSEPAQSDTYGDVPQTRWADPKRKRVRIVEMWHKDGDVWYHCIFTKGGILSSMESPYRDEEGNSVPGFVFGSAFVDRDGNRYGPAKNWLDIQDEINKRRSKALHLNSVRQVQYQKGAVDDPKKLREELAKPDGVIETNPEFKVDVLQTGDMAAAQFSFYQQSTQEIDSVGVNAAMSGAESRNMSGRALMARTESGLAELGPLFDALKQFQLDVYRAVWNRIRQFWTAEKWIRVTDDEKNVRFVGLNLPLTLGEQLLEKVRAQGQEPTPEMLQQAQQDPMMQQVVGMKNSVAELDVDIVLDDVPATASLQAEEFQMLVDLAPQAGRMPPPLFKALLQASNLRNKDKLIKELEGGGKGGPPPEMQKAMQQIQQMGQQMAEMHKALMDKQADQAIKAHDSATKRFEAETDRMAAMPVPAPELVQAIVQQTLAALMTPDGPPPPQAPPQMMPPPNQPPQASGMPAA